MSNPVILYQDADLAARQRAVTALDRIAGQASALRRSLLAGHEQEGARADPIDDQVRRLHRELVILQTLREMRDEARERDAAARAGAGQESGIVRRLGELFEASGPMGADAGRRLASRVWAAGWRPMAGHEWPPREQDGEQA